MAPATGATENEKFLVSCISNVKDGSGVFKSDWDKIGTLLGMKPHTACCRCNKIMKTIDMSNGGSADALNATFGGSGGGTPKGKVKATPKKAAKRKQTSEVEDNNEKAATPKAKKGKGAVMKEEGEEQYVTTKSGAKAESEEGV